MLREFAVFDIEGTLLNNKKLYRKIRKELFDLKIHSLLSRLYFKVFRGSCKVDGLIYDFFEGIDEKNPKLFNGVRPVLENFSERRIKLFASTGSKVLKAKEKLEQAGILGFFELVLGREIPKAGHIPLFACHLRVTLEEFSSKAVYIGDEPKDMFLAKRFGLYAIGVTNTVSERILKEAGADEVVENFEELMKFI